MNFPGKKNNKYLLGFTLLELLVSVVIIGLLSTIALPSYLNQTNKVKGAEAKSTLGVINRAQQAYFLENVQLANTLTLLDAKVPQKYYSYQISASTSTYATVTTTTQESDLRAYSSRMEKSGNNFLQIICESKDIVSINTVSTSPSTLTNCPSGYNSIN